MSMIMTPTELPIKRMKKMLKILQMILQMIKKTAMMMSLRMKMITWR